MTIKKGRHRVSLVPKLYRIFDFFANKQPGRAERGPAVLKADYLFNNSSVAGPTTPTELSPLSDCNFLTAFIVASP